MKCKRLRCPLIKNKKLSPALSSNSFTVKVPPRPVPEAVDFIYTPYESIELHLPECYGWKIDDILKWIRNVVKLPQYAQTFIVNRIEGDGLLFVNPGTLPKMNVRNPEHVKHICQHIKDLFQIDYSLFKDSISLPSAKVMRYLSLYQKNQPQLKSKDLTENEFIRCYIYHYPEPNKKECFTWDALDPSYYFSLQKTINSRTVKPIAAKRFIVNEDYKFNLRKGDTFNA